jgi:hypothetical protein
LSGKKSAVEEFTLNAHTNTRQFTTTQKRENAAAQKTRHPPVDGLHLAENTWHKSATIFLTKKMRGVKP